MNPAQQAEANLKIIVAYHNARTEQGLPDELPPKEAAAAAVLMKLVDDLNTLQRKQSGVLLERRIGAKLGLLLEASRSYIKTYIPQSEAL